MRNTPNLRIEKYRMTHPLYGKGYGNNGFFEIPQANGETLRVMSSDEEGWDHVSVSLRNRCPTWEEMCKIKDMFFRDDECVVQYHPPKKDYINAHPYVLHLWRCQTAEHPMPPHNMIA